MNYVVILNVLSFAFADVVSLKTPVRTVLFGKWRTLQRRELFLSSCQILACMRLAFYVASDFGQIYLRGRACISSECHPAWSCFERR